VIVAHRAQTDELGVSVRTVYRDVKSLSAAGDAGKSGNRHRAGLHLLYYRELKTGHPTRSGNAGDAGQQGISTNSGWPDRTPHLLTSPLQSVYCSPTTVVCDESL
jgi:hypothetical protein